MNRLVDAMRYGTGRRRTQKKHSILGRVRLMCYSITAITAFLFAVVMIQVETRGIKNQLESRAALLASSLDQAVGQDFLEADMPSVSEHCQGMLDTSDDILYIVFTRADTGFSTVISDDPKLPQRWRNPILSGLWNPPPGEMEIGIRRTALTGDEVYHYTRSAAIAGQAWGYVHIGLALTDYNNSVRMVYAGTSLVSGATMLVGALIAFFFARNLTKPLQSLQVFAHKVAAGAVTERARISTNDEIEDLADSINSMVESLERSQRKIKESMGQEAALREKEILLREIHHRVKNNMQILSSLIRLQARQADSEQLKDVLSEAEARIRSMALLHEKLYQSDSLSEIEMNSYLRTLTDEIMRMNSQPGSKLELLLDVDGILLGIDTALPCGLIVTELVTNSIKYAFPAGQEGLIEVRVTRAEGGGYSLVVRDNGVGLPAGFELSECETLGMRLVNMLTAQLNGTVQISAAQGTRTEVKFKECHYRQRI